MNDCTECLSNVDRYLDGELRGSEAAVFQQHLEQCDSCQEMLANKHAFFGHVRSSRPEMKAPQALYERVSHLLIEEERTAERSEAAGKSRTNAGWWRTWSFSLPALATAGVLIVTGILSTMVLRQHVRANAFVEMAIATHQRHVAGQLPVEIGTGSGSELTAWFSHKVPFHFRLPESSKTDMGSANYALKGGRLLSLDGHRSAYVAYQMGAEPISLLVASKTDALALGGDSLVASQITFHTHRKHGLQIVTWSVHGLTYALVSSVNVPARQSCSVCHSDPKGKEILRRSIRLSYRTTAEQLIRD